MSAQSVQQAGASFRGLTTYSNNRNRFKIKPTQLTRAELASYGEDSVVSRTQAAVPRIRYAWNGLVEDAGSGFVIDENGFILSVEHRARGSTGEMYADFPIMGESDLPLRLGPEAIDPTINAPNSKRKIDVFPIPVEVLVSSPIDQLAILVPTIHKGKYKNEAWKRIELEPTKPDNEEAVFTVGHANMERHNSVSGGKVILNDLNFDNLDDGGQSLIELAKTSSERAKYILSRNRAIWSTNAPIFPGGGPLCSEDGKAYGIACYFDDSSVDVGECFEEHHPEFNTDKEETLLPYRTSRLTLSIGVEERIFPFFQRIGINPDDILAGKPINFSDVIYRKYKRQLG